MSQLDPWEKETATDTLDPWEKPRELTPHVEVKFAPDIMTDEELQQAAIGGNPAAIKAFHEKNLAQSNPAAGARANTMVESAVEGLKSGVAGFLPGLAKMGYHAGQALGGNAIDQTTGKIPIWEDVKGMAAGLGEDVGNISAVLPSALGGQGSEMPLEQYKKAGEAVGKNVGAVAGAEFTGMGAQLVGKGISATAKVLPARLVNSVIKPQKGDFKFGGDPVRTILDEKLSGGSLEELKDNVSIRKTELNKQVEQGLLTPAATTKVIKRQVVFDALDPILKKAVEQNNQPLFDRINKFRDSLEHEMAVDAEGNIGPSAAKPSAMSPFEANKLKQEIDDQITSYTEDAVENGLNEAKFAVRTALRDNVDRQVPGTSLLNRKVGDLITAERALDRRILAQNRSNLVGPGEIIGGVAGEALGHVLHAPPGIGGALGATAKGILGSVAVKTNLAKWLGSLDVEGRTALINQYKNKTVPEEALPAPPVPPEVPKDMEVEYQQKSKQMLLDAYRKAQGEPLTPEEMAAPGIAAKQKISDYRAKETEFMRNPLEVPEPTGIEDTGGPIEGIELNQVTPTMASPQINLGKMGYAYKPNASKLVVNRIIANDIADMFNMPMFHGAELTLLGKNAPAILKLKEKMPNIFDKIPSDKPLTIQVSGSDYKPVARHEGTHRAVSQAMVPREPWLDFDSAEFNKATGTKKTYAEHKRPEEVFADLMAGRGDRLGLTRTETLQLMHDMTEHISQKYGQEAADTVMRRFIPQKRVTMAGGERIVTEPEAFKYK